jgi:hypothetical protein
VGANLSGVPFLPIPRLIAHKGITDSIDIGASYISYHEFQVIGADIKFAFFQPTEGPTIAFRFNYTHTKLDYSTDGASLSFSSQEYKPEILMSRDLDFVDPYIGIGAQYASGTLGFDIPLQVAEVAATVKNNSLAGEAFIGVVMKFPPIGLRIVLDAEYSSLGEDSIGFKFGFGF